MIESFYYTKPHIKRTAVASQELKALEISNYFIKNKETESAGGKILRAIPYFQMKKKECIQY